MNLHAVLTEVIPTLASLIEGIGVVDYRGFVDLAVENDKVHAWV